MRSLRRAAAMLLGSSLVLLVSICRADCAASFEAAQRMRNASRLREAERELVLCADRSCATWIQRECDRWHDEVKSLIPGLVVRVVDRDGCDTTQARVLVDGKEV